MEKIRHRLYFRQSFLKIPSILYQKLQHKDGRQDIHSYGQFPVFPRQQVNQHITDHSQYDTVRNAVSQRHEQDADESRNSLRIIRKVYFQHCTHHHQSYQNQHRGCSGSGYRGPGTEPTGNRRPKRRPSDRSDLLRRCPRYSLSR